MYGYPELTKQSVREKLSTDRQWIERALVLLYEFQTEDEKDEGETVEQNGKGFNYKDASVLSYYAQFILDYKGLQDNQLEDAKQRLPKYAGQILNYIQSNPNQHGFIS